MPEVEGWIDATGYGFNPDKDRFFAVHAKGYSMIPLIKDGDICIFEWYNAGPRNGEVVLTQCSEVDVDYGGKYTIKKYYSKKVVTEEGWQHTTIQLKPMNPEYSSIMLNPEEAEQYRTIGVLRHVIPNSDDV